MPYVTVYYQGHKVQFVPIHDSSSAKSWTVEQNGETFEVREFRGTRIGTYQYDLYRRVHSSAWLFQEQDIPSLDAVARAVCDTVYV